MSRGEVEGTLILGISDSHCATACLLRDGEVIGCLSEERLTRIKNQGGYPRRAVESLMSQGSVNPEEISAVALAGHEAMDAEWFELITRDEKYIDIYFGVKKGGTLRRKVRRWGKKLGFSGGAPGKQHLPNEKRFQEIAGHIGISKSKIHIVEHHTSHAAAAYYGSPFAFQDKSAAVLTNDASGDGLCATWNVGGKKGIERLAASPSAPGSLGSFYSLLTVFLGMRQLEHEYKVMGLAPYAPEEGAKNSYEVLRKMIAYEKMNGTPQFRWKVRKDRFRYLMENLVRHRFDWVAAAGQELLEEMLLEWVRAGIDAAGESRIAVSGGVFMNVKANKKVAALDEVSELFVLPSCGDESNAIGAAYWLQAQEPPEVKPQPCVPLSHLYFGKDILEEDVAETLDRMNVRERHRVQRYDDIESKVAGYLAAGDIVARVKGREEFGARALGNRSILANPSVHQVVSVINKMIKSRDFWMPFSPTVLDKREEEYLQNPKRLRSPYMMLTFDSTPVGLEKLTAACHPYDGTLRPQILEREVNPDYYRLIEIFEELTGIGAVLNTSYNLHGEPIVSNAEDAIRTFETSGLPHLALGQYLISKKNA